MKEEIQNRSLELFEKLSYISEDLSTCIGRLNEIEPLIPKKKRSDHRKTVNYLTWIYDAIDELIIETCDADERTKSIK